MPDQPEVSLRAFQEEDRPALMAVLAQPEVSRWWPDADFVAERGWVVEVEGRAAGWLEYAEEDYRWYPSVGLDIFLDEAIHGRGVGRRALRMGIEHFLQRGHHRFTLDPNAENERAIRCYRALGFRTVGTMHAYERRAAGGWNDALLMELVVAEALERDALRGSEGRP